MSGDRLVELAKTPSFLQDGLVAGQVQAPAASIQSRVEFAASTLFVFLEHVRAHVARDLGLHVGAMGARLQPIGRASIDRAADDRARVVAIVRNSLALAFSLGGIVAAAFRFRANMSDTRDIVYIFLAIVVGFAAGVQVMSSRCC